MGQFYGLPLDIHFFLFFIYWVWTLGGWKGGCEWEKYKKNNFIYILCSSKYICIPIGWMESLGFSEALL